MNAAERQKRIADVKRRIARLKARQKAALAKRHSSVAHAISLQIQGLEKILHRLEGDGGGDSKEKGKGDEKKGLFKRLDGGRDPFQKVTITSKNAKRLAAHYKRRPPFLSRKEKAWWESRLAACLRALKARAPHRKDVRALRGRAAELRRKAVAARSMKRYAQSQSYVQQAERLEQSAAAEADWQPTGEGHVRERFEGRRVAQSERDVQAEGGEEAASEGDDEKVSKDVEAMESGEKPWYTKWWAWGLGALAVGGAVALSRGGKLKGLLKVRVGKPSGDAPRSFKRVSSAA